jgi:hypothetical protein
MLSSAMVARTERQTGLLRTALDDLLIVCPCARAPSKSLQDEQVERALQQLALPGEAHCAEHGA